MLIWV